MTVRPDHRPPVELLTAGTTPAGFADLVLKLSQWCHPIAGAPWEHDSPPVATMASSARALGLDAALDAGRPVAVWATGEEDEHERARLERATALLCTDSLESDEAPADRLVHVPVPGIDLAAWPATMPHVRARQRRALGLPDPLVLDLTQRSDEDSRRRLGLASAAVVDTRWAITALALATPTVTDPATSASLGALDDVHVVVSRGAEKFDAAAGLAADAHRAARLARAGRRLVELRHDRGAAAVKAARLLGLYPGPRGPRELLADRIEELEVTSR